MIKDKWECLSLRLKKAAHDNWFHGVTVIDVRLLCVGEDLRLWSEPKAEHYEPKSADEDDDVLQAIIEQESS